MAKKAGASWRGFARRNRFAKSQSSSFFWLLAAAAAVLSVHRNKIKCGEEKTPLLFGDIAIVIGEEGTSPKICELVAKR